MSLGAAESFCAQTLATQTRLDRKVFRKNFVLQSLHKALPSTTVYHKSLQRVLPSALCTTKLAQSTSQYYFVLQHLHKLVPSTICTTKLAQTTPQYYCLLQNKLAKSTSQYYFALQSLQKVFPSTTLYYKTCTSYFPVLLSTTKACKKALPSTTLYYNACTKHVPVLLCTTKLAQSTSQYYFALQSLHKALPRTTLYYKSLQRVLPSTVYHKSLQRVLPSALCTTKLAQSTSQYYFVLQHLHKLVPSTTLHYKACTKHVPVLLSTTKLAKHTSQYYFVFVFPPYPYQSFLPWRGRARVRLRVKPECETVPVSGRAARRCGPGTRACQSALPR